MKEIELRETIANILHEIGLKYVQEPIIGNARPDFLVTTSDGAHIVIELKTWESNPDNFARAVNQAQRYKELSGAQAALVVAPTGPSSIIQLGGVTSVTDFVATIQTLIQELSKVDKHPETLKSTQSPEMTVFASMPFSSQYDDTFLVAMRPAALSIRAIAERVDHDGVSGDIVHQIKQMIRKSKIVIADLSESRPNVCHEVGYAEAIGKSILQICSTDINALPFNLRNNATISYRIGQTTKLRARIETELRKAIGPSS